jgi:uncharacterized protein
MFLNLSSAGKNEIWRYCIGVMGVLLMYFLGQLPLEIVKELQIRKHSEIGTAEEKLFLDTLDFSILHLDKNVGLLLLLSMFIFAMIGLYLIVTKLNSKNFKDIMTTRSSIDYKRVFFGFGLWALIIAVSEVISFFINPDEYKIIFEPASWSVLILICIFILPIQTSFEELFFRGYIMQGIYHHTRKPWIAIVGSSVLFAMMHGTNPEIAKYGFGVMISYYILAASFLAYITLMDHGIELALGVHWATNFMGAAFLTYEGSVMQTASIFSVKTMNPYLLVVIFIIGAALFSWLASRKYLWRSFSPLQSENSTLSA